MFHIPTRPTSDRQVSNERNGIIHWHSDEVGACLKGRGKPISTFPVKGKEKAFEINLRQANKIKCHTIKFALSTLDKFGEVLTIWENVPPVTVSFGLLLFLHFLTLGFSTRTSSGTICFSFLKTVSSGY